MKRCLICDKESKTETCINCWREHKRLRREIQKEVEQLSRKYVEKLLDDAIKRHGK